MSGSKLPRPPPNEGSHHQTQPDYPSITGDRQPFKHEGSDFTLAGTANPTTSSHLASQYPALQHQIEYTGVLDSRSRQEAAHSTPAGWDNQNLPMSAYSTNNLTHSLPAPGYIPHFHSSHYVPSGDPPSEYNNSGYGRQLGNGPYNGPNEVTATDQQAYNPIPPQSQQVYQPYSGHPLPPIQHAPAPLPVSRHLNPPLEQPSHYQHTAMYGQTQSSYNMPPPQDYTSSSTPRMTNHPYTLPPPLPPPQITTRTQPISSFDIGRSRQSPAMPSSNYPQSSTCLHPDQQAASRRGGIITSRSPPSLRASTSAASSNSALDGTTGEGEGGAARHKCNDPDCVQRAPFSTYGNLRRHVREQHNGTAKKYSCEICEVVFTRATARDNHQNQKRCKKQHRPGLNG